MQIVSFIDWFTYYISDTVLCFFAGIQFVDMCARIDPVPVYLLLINLSLPAQDDVEHCLESSLHLPNALEIIMANYPLWDESYWQNF